LSNHVQKSVHDRQTVITDRLLLEAKRLLIHTPQSVKQIALQLGFEEATHFNKFFKKQQHITPKVFRENYLATYGTT
jgi:transcriptional regulator, araC family